MGTQYSYYLRPGYGTKALLIEFNKGSGSDTLVRDLLNALAPINATISETLDLWMNDEMVYSLKTDVGKLELSHGAYDFVFIMAWTNQKGILRVNELLEAHPDFTRDPVDFRKYELDENGKRKDFLGGMKEDEAEYPGEGGKK